MMWANSLLVSLARVSDTTNLGDNHQSGYSSAYNGIFGSGWDIWARHVQRIFVQYYYVVLKYRFWGYR